MQSVRGLRWAVSSTSPRYALFHGPSRSIWISAGRHSIKQTQRPCRIKRLAPLREGDEGRVRAIQQERRIYTAKEHLKAPAENGRGSKSTKLRLEDPSILPKCAHSKDNVPSPQDLCSSVTATMAKLPHPAVVITTLDRTYHAQAAAGVPIEEMRHPIARGVTVSSLTSLCIRPRPHVMFNMTLPSTMFEALVACKDFNVHVLTPDEAGARIANVFTRGNRLPPPPAGEVEGADYDLDADADLGVFVGLKEEGLPHVEIVNRTAWHQQYRDAKEDILPESESSPDADTTAQTCERVEPMGQIHHVPHLHSSGIIEVLNCRLVRTIYPELPNAGQNVIMIGEVVSVTAADRSYEELNQVSIALSYANRKYRTVGDAIHLR
ncbi:flavin reductase like domain-containing protein [Xylaria arbuscula]|nr:flavin reductase like domain-containing protein [Xylaria arbuscula]